MAFTKIASVSAASVDAGATVVTAGIDTSGSDLIVVHISDFVNGTGALSDSKGNSYTPLTPQSVAANVRSRLYYKLSPTVGSGHTFTYTSTIGTTFPSIQVIAFSGSAAFDQQSGNVNLSGTTLFPGSLTPPSNAALFVTGVGLAAAQGGTTAINLSFTLETGTEFSGGNAEGGFIAFLIQGTAAALDPAWSWAGSNAASSTMATFTTGAAPRFILGTH